LIGAALLLNAALASATLKYLVTSVTDPRQGMVARLDCYLHKGQLQADARTLAAALDYVLSADRDLPATTTTTNLAVLPVVEEAATGALKS
jgi:hypothetical protein